MRRSSIKPTNFAGCGSAGSIRLNELGQAIFSEIFAAESSGSQTWPERTISELADILVGFPFKSAHYIQSGRKIRLCRGANVLPGQIDWSDVAYLDEKRRSEFPLYELQSSDIVIAMDRPWISSGFKVAQITSEDTPSLLVQRVARIRSKQPEDSDFLFFLVRNPLFSKHCKPTETTVPHISPTEIKSFSFCCPPESARARFSALIRERAPVFKAQNDHLRKLNYVFSSLQHRAFQGEL